MEVFLGIDWGGTYLKAGLVDSKGKIVAKKVYSSAELKKKQGFIKNLKSLLKSFSGFAIRGVGIGAPGIIDIEKGFIYYLPNIPGWKNYPLKSVLTKSLGLPVFIDNDANAFALAESRFGAARGKKRAIFLTLGTGLGGAVIFNHQLIEGKTSAAELGHVPINPQGKLCGCGGRGCIETYVGNRYLISDYRRLKKNKTTVKEVKQLFEKGLKGEREALVVWNEFSHNLGKFLAGMINVFNPQVIIFGGGVSGAFRLFKPLVEKEIKKQVMWPQNLGVKLVRARLKDAGIVGAALLAKENL
ncbi:MAG: ROK family protein [Candidatus Omnitrophota bacterium]